ncbi:MAG: hypothetical protein KGH92_08310 [Xanthomonadaceae bacterium]|nr:hypothetical protein [Xanthomonadaceae bacterium]
MLCALIELSATIRCSRVIGVLSNQPAKASSGPRLSAISASGHTAAGSFMSAVIQPGRAIRLTGTIR